MIDSGECLVIMLVLFNVFLFLGGFASLSDSNPIQLDNPTHNAIPIASHRNQQFHTISTVSVQLTQGKSQRHIFGPFKFSSAVALTAFQPLLPPLSYVHHLVVHRSDTAYKTNGLLNNKQASQCCSLPNNIIYAWAKTQLTNRTDLFTTYPGTGFILNTPPQTESVLYIEGHFEPPATSSPTASLGLSVGFVSLDSTESYKPLAIGLMYASYLHIKQNTHDSQVCVKCKVNFDLNVIAFRNHAHLAARTIGKCLWFTDVIICFRI